MIRRRHETMTDCHEYCGAIHVHTAYGDGSATMPEVVAAASAAGLDFVVITDHWMPLARRDGWEGFHEGVVVIVGAELHNEAGRVHYLAVGASHTPPEDADLREAGLARFVHDHGGRIFLAHPQGVPETLYSSWSRPWTGAISPAVDGLEVWSYMHDWLEDFRAHRLLRFHRRPEEQITGPNPVVLAAWDRLAQERRVAAVGGLDNHGRAVPLTGRTFLPYVVTFGGIRTHVLLDRPLTGSTEADIRAVSGALGGGAAFVANDALADSTGLRFTGSAAGGAQAGPGGEIDLATGGVDLRLAAPTDADWRVVCAGRTVARARGRDFACRVDVPGAYHVQGRLNGRFWLMTNPVYVRTPTGPADR